MSFQPPTPPTGNPIGSHVPLVPGPTSPPLPGPQPVGGSPASPRPSRRGRIVAFVAAGVLAATTIGGGIWVAGLGDTVNERDATIDSLLDEQDDLDERATELDDEAAGTEDDLNAADATVDSLTDAVAQAQDDLADVLAELEVATATITELEGGAPPGTTTAPSDGSLPPLDPNDERNDGEVSAAEYATLSSVLDSMTDDVPELTHDQAQDIADRACAVTSQIELFDEVVAIQEDYLPAGTVTDTSLLVGVVAGAACIDRLVALAG